MRGVGCFIRVQAAPRAIRGFRPLAGCGLFPHYGTNGVLRVCFRPLAGCGLFLFIVLIILIILVSVPLRGVGCFLEGAVSRYRTAGFRPLAGCGLFLGVSKALRFPCVSVPLRGVGCFFKTSPTLSMQAFPSPCGVWVVSAKLHILSGATGKRIVNSAVLLYHIGRWFINSKMRNWQSAVRSA